MNKAPELLLILGPGNLAIFLFRTVLLGLV